MKKKKKKNSRQFKRQFKTGFFTRKSVPIIVFSIMIIFGISVGCVGQARQAARYKDTIRQLNTEVKDIKKTNEELEEQRDTIDSEEFKERIAREKFGLVGEDEYRLEESEDAKTGDENNSDDTATSQPSAE